MSQLSVKLSRCATQRGKQFPSFDHDLFQTATSVNQLGFFFGVLMLAFVLLSFVKIS